MPKKKRVPKDAVVLEPADIERLRARYTLYQRALDDSTHAEAVAAMLGESYGAVSRDVRERYGLSRVYTVDWETGVVTPEPDPPEEAPPTDG